jgi:hypothetical protein
MEAQQKRTEYRLGFKLLLLSFWTPSFILQRELNRVSLLTSDALESLLKKQSAELKSETLETRAPMGGRLKEKRTAMAREHTRLVEILERVLGRDEAIKRAREVLFNVGNQLGKETRLKLGSGESLKDMIRSAKVLYRVLGISFKVENINGNTGTIVINRCALAKDYSELACQVLSATDEGVINGLNPRMTMSFTQRMTSGCQECKAKITVRPDGGE